MPKSIWIKNSGDIWQRDGEESLVVVGNFDRYHGYHLQHLLSSWGDVILWNINPRFKPCKMSLHSSCCLV